LPITISVDIDSLGVMGSLEVMPGLIEVETEKALVISTALVEAEVKALTPRRTGRLFSAWESRVAGYTGRVSNNVSYAGYIEAGTGPHDIVAHGRALVIPVGARTLSGRAKAGAPVMFRKRVRHPGFAGRHMARLGLDAALPAVKQVFRDAVKDAIRLALGK
jgi:hypothetical protein